MLRGIEEGAEKDPMHVIPTVPEPSEIVDAVGELEEGGGIAGPAGSNGKCASRCVPGKVAQRPPRQILRDLCRFINLRVGGFGQE